MKNFKKFFSHDIRYCGDIGFYLEVLIYKIYNLKSYFKSDKKKIETKFEKIFSRKVNWESPQTLNEKIQWLKLFGFEDFHTICADKYRVREYLLKKFGDNRCQIPILYVTDDWRNITLDNIPDVPCVVKANHTQGDVWIIKKKDEVDIDKLRTDCRWALRRNLYYETQEPQYRDIKPLIIIEKLLLDHEGRIPNDYKLHFFNGKLEFIYCSIGRETINKRNIYDAEWKPLHFNWSGKTRNIKNKRGPEIPPPPSFEEMKRMGSEIAKDFKYVRVDFYDVDGIPYLGEITLHHGSGTDVFVPEEYDNIYGAKLNL